MTNRLPWPRDIEHVCSDDIVVRLDDLGYSPDTYRLLAWTPYVALLVLHSGCVALDLEDGRSLWSESTPRRALAAWGAPTGPRRRGDSTRRP